MTLGSPLVVDVHDDAQRQVRLVRVLGHQVDGFEAFIVMVALALAGDPVQHEVGGGHQNELARVEIEGIFARSEGFFPDAPVAARNALAVAEAFAGHVLPHRAVVADDHANIADGHHRLGIDLHGGEPAVDEIGAVGEWHILPAAPAAAAQEGFGVLVVVVVVGVGNIIADRGRDDLAGRQARAIMNGDDADAVHRHALAGRKRVLGGHRVADHDRIKRVDVAELFLPADDRRQFRASLHFQAVDRVFGDDDEQGDS